MMKLVAFPILFSVVLSGCAALSSDVNSASAPTLVINAATPPPADSPAEVKPPSPGVGHLWVAGYWDYVGGHYVWRAGRWVETKPGYAYVKAQWENGPSGWQLHVPHWQRQHQADPRLARAQ